MSVRDHDVNCVRDHDFAHNVVCHRRMLEIGMNDETRMKQLDDMQASADFIEAVLMSLTSDLESIREDRKDNGSQPISQQPPTTTPPTATPSTTNPTTLSTTNTPHPHTYQPATSTSLHPEQQMERLPTEQQHLPPLSSS